MAKILVSIYPEKRQLERLDKLSAMTRVPKAEYIREGINLLLNKYEAQTREGHKKEGNKKGDNYYHQHKTCITLKRNHLINSLSKRSRSNSTIHITSKYFQK
jgi:predicted DNA-binding protein